jgi:hypothetical protein
MKIFIRYIFITFLFCATATVCSSQNNPVITKIIKFKPPEVKTLLGTNQNGAVVTGEEGAQLLALPLKIVDEKNNSYTIDSYQFLYRRKGVIEDEQTGKKEVTFTIVSDRFYTTPLPKVWIDNIKDNLKRDEQLYYFDVVVKDKQGRRFPAPELKITIQ